MFVLLIFLSVLPVLSLHWNHPHDAALVILQIGPHHTLYIRWGDAPYFLEAARQGANLAECRNFDADPVAEIELPQRVPYGAHGSWMPAE